MRVCKRPYCLKRLWLHILGRVYDFKMNNSTSKEIYRVKEDLLLKNFLDKSRRDKAKVLRLQQVCNRLK